MAADDEEPPSDTARENHGDDAGKCHVFLIGFVVFVKAGGGADDESHEEGNQCNPYQGDDGAGFQADDIGDVLIGFNK